MKKTKFIAFTLVLAVILMGAGYAYWTDSLTIKNSVTTGKFNLIFGQCTHEQDYDNYHSNGDAFNGGYDYVNPPYGIPNVGFSEDYQTLTFTSVNHYPGSGAWLKFKIINNGSVPAIVESITGYIDPDDQASLSLKNEFRYTINGIQLYQDGSLTDVLYNQEAVFNDFDSFITELSNRLSKYPNGDQIILYPGQSIEINGVNTAEGIRPGYDIYLREDVDESTANGTLTELNTFSFDLRMKYKQWNQ